MALTDGEQIDAAAFSERLDRLGAGVVHIGLMDPDGTFRHKRVAREKAEKLLRDGYQFCDVLYDWDISEQTYAGGAFIDRPARLFPDTLRAWPFAPGEAICLADYAAPFGERSARNQLIGLIGKARAMGFSVHAAFEYEFMLFDETPESIRAKNYRDIRHFAAGNRTYSLQTMARHNELFAGLASVMDTLGIGIDALHTELGAGTFEAPLTHAEGVKAADDAALFKNMARAYFLRHDLVAGFMSKFDAQFSGQSGHLHLSLRRLSDATPAFHDPQAPDGLSQTARHFAGGLVRLMPEWLALCAQTVNAYKRLVPGAWAPTYANWGIQNRTVAVRAMADTPAATRLEFRVPAADSNPYATLAMCLGAGLHGLEHHIDPPAPRDDDCYVTAPSEGAAFPRDLSEAADRLDASETARSTFGNVFIDTFVHARRMEAAAYARIVHQWELARYLEVS